MNSGPNSVLRIVVVLAATAHAGVSRAADAGVPVPAVSAPAIVSAFETRFHTHVGEGSAGVRRVFRNGCYQSESSGSPGGGPDVHDSEAGCTELRAFADMFAHADALVANGALVTESASDAKAKTGAKVAKRGLAFVSALDDALQGLDPVLVCVDGRRLVAKDSEAAEQLARVVGSEPSIDPWYVTPPKPPTGSGGQLIALSARKDARSGSRTLQATLVANGPWWCHRSVPAGSSDPPESFARSRPAPLTKTQAGAILDRVLAGISARALADGEAKDRPGSDRPIQVEAAVGAGPRTQVRRAVAATAAATRFRDEMRAQSAACQLP